jgi:MFS family permease
MTSSAPTPPKSSQALSYPIYRLYWAMRLFMSFGIQIISVSVGWQIYDMTGDPFYLGFVGLVQFLPALLLVLVTGLVADRFPRKAVIQLCLLVEFACAIALCAFALWQGHEVWVIFLVLLLFGVARAFVSPAQSALAPNIVPPVALASAIALNVAAWQLASILGPFVGGLLYDLSPVVAYGVAATLMAVGMIFLAFVRSPPQTALGQRRDMSTMLAGFRYIWREKIVLGAISLDLFAVLLGGAVALMPVFARDILDVGAWGLGLLRGAPGAGALLTTLVLMRFPIRDRAGIILFVFVGLFGLLTLLFGLSTSIWFSIPLLALIGAADMVSVSVRETIMQLWTPDEMRGRVNAVNSVFIGASNELGEFRAGMMAGFIGLQVGVAVGAQIAVALGGASTMAVAGIWARMFPGLLRQRSLDRKMVEG